MSFTISTLTLEAFLLVLVRVACFTSIAPIFGHNSLNARMKISIAFFVSLILYQVVDVSLPEYTNVLGYTTLVLEEALVGLLLGFVAGLSMKALAIAGEFIDREIGFSMATTFDPNQGMVTITGELYDKIVFRIAMPVFLGATMLNVILGVLAKSSPQMNMFAIGMQLKVFVGLFLLAVCIMFVPNIANYIMERMRDMIQTILGGL